MIADLRVLVDRRELLVDFAWRELRARYKGSALGFLWNFVNPLLQLVVFWILFGVVLRTRPITASGEQPYAIFLFVGTGLFTTSYLARGRSSRRRCSPARRRSWQTHRS